ncbi:hypothetical protein GYB61_03865, partial [bacterium]|nr:hypothetical protein [bacterium]
DGDYEQATLHRSPPDIAPTTGTDDATVADFNARQQQALMTAGSAAPEDVPTETYAQALQELTGVPAP